MRISSSAYMGVETLVRLAVQTADIPCTKQGLAEWLRLAGIAGPGVLFEILNADGEIATRDELFAIGKQHAIPVLHIDTLLDRQKSQETA
jgi:hypothetical protein